MRKLPQPGFQPSCLHRILESSGLASLTLSPSALDAPQCGILVTDWFVTALADHHE